MDRAEGTGLGVAFVGHAALFAALSFGLFAAKNEMPRKVDAIEVSFAEETALQSAAPATEAPAPSQAPELGTPSEAPPPEPTPAPPVPEPTPAPPIAQPAPTSKPSPAKPAPQKPAPPTAKAEPRPRLSANILKGLRDASPSREPARGARLGDNFLKGIADAPAGRGQAQRAATVSQVAMNGLGAAIRRQVQPCYQLGALGGTSAMQIVTVLRLRFNRDGSVAGSPQVVEQTGVSAANRSYARQMEDVSRRAVLRCAPLKLPAELYEGGWEDIDLGFIPSQMD